MYQWKASPKDRLHWNIHNSSTDPSSLGLGIIHVLIDTGTPRRPPWRSPAASPDWAPMFHDCARMQKSKRGTSGCSAGISQDIPNNDQCNQTRSTCVIDWQDGYKNCILWSFDLTWLDLTWLEIFIELIYSFKNIYFKNVIWKMEAMLSRPQCVNNIFHIL